jgi:hypothetical protein
MDTDYNKIQDNEFFNFFIYIAYYGCIFIGISCVILSCLFCFLLLLMIPIVGIIFVSISPSTAPRVELIRNYNQIASEWQNTHYPNFNQFKFHVETSGVSKNLASFSPVDKINDSPKNGENFPNYTHYALKNSSVSYFINETFQTNQFVSLDLFFNSNSSSTRKFGKTVFIEKFKSNTVTLDLKQCSDQGGTPSGIGMCTFNFILDSACVEVDLTTETHTSCPGYTYGDYSVLKSTQGKFTVHSDFLIREKNDPFSWVYRVTNGSLSFGSVVLFELLITGIILIVVGGSIVFLSLLVVIAFAAVLTILGIFICSIQIMALQAQAY